MRQACCSPLLLPVGQAYSNNRKKKEVPSLKTLCVCRLIASNDTNNVKLPLNCKNFLSEFQKSDLGLSSTKLNALVSYIHNIPQDEHVLVFTEWTKLLKMAVNYLNAARISWAQVDGTQSMGTRTKNADKLRNRQVKVLLCSLKVACEGLNLCEANHVVFLEPWWNPAVHHQAAARANRTGQTKQVHVVYFIIKDTVEKKVLEIGKVKEEMSKAVLANANSRARRGTGLGREVMRALLQ